jgi:tripartite-type tricarboxylate transporter receptor subunit TctC
MMKHSRRVFLRMATGAATLPALSHTIRAQAYPNRPVRMIVGFAAGGGGDTLMRLMGQWLSERLGQPFIVENRPGAGTNIAAEVVARAPADGHTLLYVSPASAINATLYRTLSFNFLSDIAPVARIGHQPLVMEVNPSVPAETVPDFVAYAKANPGKVSFGSSGNGNTPHMAGELFKMMAGVDMVHVPYRGEAPALTDLLAGRVQVMFSTMPSSIGYIKAGRLRAMAVTTRARAEALPELPTLADFVTGYEVSSWNGMGAPAKTPAHVVETLNREINAALADPKLKARLADLGNTVTPGSPTDFREYIERETEKWATVIKFANVKLI